MYGPNVHNSTSITARKPSAVQLELAVASVSEREAPPKRLVSAGTPAPHGGHTPFSEKGARNAEWERSGSCVCALFEAVGVRALRACTA